MRTTTSSTDGTAFAAPDDSREPLMDRFVDFLFAVGERRRDALVSGAEECAGALYGAAAQLEKTQPLAARCLKDASVRLRAAARTAGRRDLLELGETLRGAVADSPALFLGGLMCAGAFGSFLVRAGAARRRERIHAARPHDVHERNGARTEH